MNRSFYDDSIIRAMKRAYRECGYDLAENRGRTMVATAGWGVNIANGYLSYGIKSLIVLHNGDMPKAGAAVHVQKKECCEAMLGVVTATMDDFMRASEERECDSIKPTRLTLDGFQLWQETDTLNVRLVNPNDQQILDGIDIRGCRLVNDYIFLQTWFGCVYVQARETLRPEDKPLLDYIGQRQMIALDLED